MEFKDMMSGVWGAGGVIAAMLGKLFLDWYKSKRTSDTDDNSKRFTQLEAERKDLVAAQVAIRQDLMNQILELRSAVLKFQEQNMQYVKDNVSLSAKVETLENENKELLGRVKELESEVHQLRNNSVPS